MVFNAVEGSLGERVEELENGEEGEWRRTATSRIGQPWKTVALNWRAPFLDAYCAPPRAARAAGEG